MTDPKDLIDEAQYKMSKYEANTALEIAQEEAIEAITDLFDLKMNEYQESVLRLILGNLWLDGRIQTLRGLQKELK